MIFPGQHAGHLSLISQVGSTNFWSYPHDVVVVGGEGGVVAACDVDVGVAEPDEDFVEADALLEVEAAECGAELPEGDAGELRLFGYDF